MASILRKRNQNHRSSPPKPNKKILLMEKVVAQEDVKEKVMEEVGLEWVLVGMPWIFTCRL